MGSYAPQGYGSGTGSAGSNTQLPTTETLQDEAITVTDSFTNQFSFRLDETVDMQLVLYNDDTSKALSFQIWATAKDSVGIPADSDDSWYNILNEVDDPADYDTNLAKAIPAKGVHRESLSNRFGWIRIDMRTTSGTLTAKTWLRATTP